MPKIALLITLIFIVVFAIYLKNYFLPSTLSNLHTVIIDLAGKTFLLEVADTLPSRSLGLSNRSQLCPTCGMIFIFPSEGIHPFWMKDTHIPLDLIWLDKNGYIISIQQANPEPNTSVSKLKIYQNPSPAQYTIELNQNTCQNLGVKVGHKINLPYVD